ncbi:hypothetical protein HPB48_001031 [Haemaphysalis longicornis]|uniref:Signal peptidase complex catalytic subunit SEC11 n=1 Tax=Haemaphysalis longicornis TaxID=44386 RepID=A0A9J6FYB3_HAELO|nr:hypothetical protein HPB48_001031 [Haemaphysalis longicornis]
MNHWRLCKRARWLSLEIAVSRIIDQWTEWKAHFEMGRRTEKCYAAEVLYGMYENQINLGYLLFLRPILADVQKVNKAFEAKYADQTKLLKDLMTLLSSLVKKVVIPTELTDVLTCRLDDNLNPKPYLGYLFKTYVDNVKAQKTDGLSLADEAVMRESRIRFITTLVELIRQRIPDKIKVIQETSLLSIENALCVVKEPWKQWQCPMRQSKKFKTSGAKSLSWTGSKYRPCSRSGRSDLASIVPRDIVARSIVPSVGAGLVVGEKTDALTFHLSLQLLYQVLNFGMIVSSALMIWKGLMVVTGSGSPIVVVLSGSMEPAFHRGDLLFLTNYKEDPIRVGDIVVFKVEGRDIPIVHRVLKLHEKEDGSVKILTKGDNNSVDDRGLYAPGQMWLDKKDIVGRARG